MFDDRVRSAYLTIARKNGKSALIAVVLMAHLCGPLNVRNWRACVASCDESKSGELLRQISEIKKASDIPDSRLKIFADKVTGESDTEVSFLSGSGTSGQSLGVDIACLDEIGLLPERQRSLVNSMSSSVSGRDGRLLAISILGSGPFLPEARERAKTLDSVFYQEFSGKPGADLLDESNWAASNPGLSCGIKSLASMRAQAEAAAITPLDQNLFRSLMLNEKLNPNQQTIVTVDQWQACLVEQLPPREGPCVIGWDLGSSNSFCSAAALWRNGRLEVWSAIGGVPPLAERSAADGHGRQLYPLMESRGELRVYEGSRITPINAFIADVVSRLAGENVLAVGCDRFKQADALQALEDAKIHWPIEFRGSGKGRDGVQDTTAAQRLILSRTLKAQESLMLSLAISQSVIQYDTNGNACLNKTNTKARIDLLSALVIASGLYEKHLAKKKKSRRYIGIVGE